MKKTDYNLKWFNNARVITSLIIITILLIFVCSQSIAVGGNDSFRIFSSVINHNTSYLFILIYFVLIRTKFGKRYFNYLNVFIIFIYFILSITSFLTIIQSFSINTIIEFILNFVILIYLFHTMFRDTRIWKEFKLGDSPFNEIPNDYFFSSVIILITISLIINLIYLYREYLDQNKLDINNKGSFDSVKTDVSQNIDNFSNDIKEKVDDVINKYDLDKKVNNAKDKLVETGIKIKEKTEDMIKEDKKIKSKKSKGLSKKKSVVESKKKGDK